MKKLILVLTIVFSLLAFVIVANIHTVAENQFALVVRWGEVIDIKDKPCVTTTVPLVDGIIILEKAGILYDLNESDVITSDKKQMVADSFVIWRIKDPLLFYKTLGTSLINAENRIDTVVYSATKGVISSTVQKDVISGRDGKLDAAIVERIGTATETQYGIALEWVEVKKLDLPEANKEKVFERMISERAVIATQQRSEGNKEAQNTRNSGESESRKLIAQAKTQAEKTISEGEKEYMRILSEVFTDPEKLKFYNFLLKLEAMEGLPGEEKTVIVGADSYLGNLFQGPDSVISK